MWWAFHRRERCKHILAYQAGETMDAQRAVKPFVRQESVRVVSVGETFTVRRAISFGPIAESQENDNARARCEKENEDLDLEMAEPYGGVA
jgi:hypothetical protein